MLDEILSNLETFNKSSFLKKGVSLYLANYFDLKDDKEKFYEYFTAMDLDKDGQINMAELINAFLFKVSQTFIILFKQIIPKKNNFPNIPSKLIFQQFYNPAFEIKQQL